MYIFFLGWPQGQFIQQIPASGQPAFEGYSQQYPNGIYQTTYQQAPFDGNTFYTGAVQVLTNTRPPSAPNHSQLTPHANGGYSHTPSPVPAQPQQPPTPQGNTQQRQYHQEYTGNTQNYIAPATTPTPSMDSRPSSVNSTVNTSTSSQNFTQQQQQSNTTYTSISNSNFSPGSNTTPPNYTVSNMNSNSGNAKPGYPQVNSNPQLVSLNSSGCPGSNQYSGNNEHIQHTWDAVAQPDNQVVWDHSETDENKMQNEYGQQQDQHYAQNEAASDSKDLHRSSQNQQSEPQFSQADRVNLNTRLKTMILNKQQNMENKLDENQKIEQNSTGHFLSYSHHHRLSSLGGGGGENFNKSFRGKSANMTFPNGLIASNVNKTTLQVYPKDNFSYSSNASTKQPNISIDKSKAKYSSTGKAKLDGGDGDNLKTNVGTEIPPCDCFPSGMLPPEPGSYYTHLGE